MVTPYPLVDGLLLTAANGAACYTADVPTRITSNSFYNSHTSAVTITCYVVPLAGSATAANLIGVKSLQAGETWTNPWMLGRDMKVGGFITLVPSVDSKIGVSISGNKITQ